MMIVQLVSKDKETLEEIAETLLSKNLIVQLMMNQLTVLTKNNDKKMIQQEQQFKLQGISKTLLFNEINKVLRDRFKQNMPLLYSEPLILMDPEQRDQIMDNLAKV